MLAWVLHSPISWNTEHSSFDSRSNPTTRFHALERRKVARQPALKAVLQEPTTTALPAVSEPVPESIRLGFTTAREVEHRIPLEVIGQLPPYLGSTGAYYLIGPGVFEVIHKDGLEYVPDHWFDAIAIVHAFFFDANDNAVYYRNKITGKEVMRTMASFRKDEFVSIKAIQRRELKCPVRKLWHMLALPTRDPLSGRFPINIHTTLQQLPGKGTLNASADFNMLQRLDPITLETQEIFDFRQFHPKLKDFLTSSHGMHDETTGEYFNFKIQFSLGKVKYTVYRIKASGEVDIVVEFRDHLYLMHSFAMTENYLVMIMCPNELDPVKLLMTKSIVESCRMRPNTDTKFVIISRKLNKIVCTYKHAPFCFLHILNAYEQGDDVIIDLTWYETNDHMRQLSIENMVKSAAQLTIGKPVRFVLDRISQAISCSPGVVRHAQSRMIADIAFEMPDIAPSTKGRKYRYCYGTSDAGNHYMGDLKKLDVQSGSWLSWSAPGVFIGEPTFVPDPNGVNEDDGSIISVGLDTLSQKSFLLVLDARTMTETGRGMLPMSLPFAFHGSYHP